MYIMNLDKSQTIYELQREDIEALGQPYFSDTVPVSEAETLLRRAEERRQLNAGRDVSGLPLGGTRNVELANIQQTELVLKGIIGVVRSAVEASVSGEVEAFLRDR